MNQIKLKWVRMSNHIFQSKDRTNKGEYTLWARVDEHNNTMYQVYSKSDVDMTKEN